MCNYKYLLCTSLALSIVCKANSLSLKNFKNCFENPFAGRIGGLRGPDLALGPEFEHPCNRQTHTRPVVITLFTLFVRTSVSPFKQNRYHNCRSCVGWPRVSLTTTLSCFDFNFKVALSYRFLSLSM